MPVKPSDFSSIAALTVAGTLLGAAVWFVAYNIVSTPAIEFDGPAGLFLSLTMIGFGFVFGMINILMYSRKKSGSWWLKAFGAMVIAGFFACLFLVPAISKYEIDKHSRFHCSQTGC